ncbi:hypothetical protein KSC_068540 [Ktedonobacter sp. SOSP1-52]|uniref:hypothetical protein n=1 Tax=Ktedonobacter sp. SOSP1-52 TaxID=2778366 RepID=UPI0019164F5D|nr:hypothetical protein [Ktedonobacter sp. SOSP1-52]GHO67962.1 hypothetical protein KSC_068540 [Ktedonobacter sp. SOSP1-52]
MKHENKWLFGMIGFGLGSVLLLSMVVIFCIAMASDGTGLVFPAIPLIYACALVLGIVSLVAFVLALCGRLRSFCGGLAIPSIVFYLLVYIQGEPAPLKNLFGIVGIAGMLAMLVVLVTAYWPRKAERAAVSLE